MIESELTIVQGEFGKIADVVRRQLCFLAFKGEISDKGDWP